MNRIRSFIGVCPQADVVFPGLSCNDHLLLYSELKGASADQDLIHTALEAVGLAVQAHVPLSKLSGGQKRKMCLAVALLNGCSTVFLDEPTSGLDPSSRRFVWQLIRKV